MIYASLGKRLLDLVIAVSAIVLLLPLLIVTAIAIVIDDGRPVLFSQIRVGKGDSRFRVRKFRSMKTDAANLPSASAPTDAITRVGKFIRRTNIDELPQLVSVLTGKMSIVGPRPALESQSILLELRAKSGAAGIRPGLTGLAQVNAFDGMSEEQKAEWDANYADRVSFVTDIRILLRTVVYLFKRPPVY